MDLESGTDIKSLYARFVIWVVDKYWGSVVQTLGKQTFPPLTQEKELMQTVNI